MRPVLEIGRRRRRQPAPPHVVREALTHPDRDPSRPWLMLLDDEVRPVVLDGTSDLAWSSLWTRRPDARVEFDLPRSADGGTDLAWILLVDEPVPDAALTGHLCKRLNQLLNANLRYSFGQ